MFGLHDRGTLEVGKAADVVVFDYDTVAPGPLRRIRDFPADGERLVADQPEGMRHVIVNGTVIREDEHAGRRRARAAAGPLAAVVAAAHVGRFLRRPAAPGSAGLITPTGVAVGILEHGEPGTPERVVRRLLHLVARARS